MSAWYPGKFLHELRDRGYQETTQTAVSIPQQQAAFRKEWLAKGATPAQVDKADLLADDWAESLSRFSSGGNPALQQQIKQAIYPRALNTTAANWLSAIMMQVLKP